MSQFLEGGGGRIFFIFVTISYVTITLGGDGVNSINTTPGQDTVSSDPPRTKKLH